MDGIIDTFESINDSSCKIMKGFIGELCSIICEIRPADIGECIGSGSCIFQSSPMDIIDQLSWSGRTDFKYSFSEKHGSDSCTIGYSITLIGDGCSEIE